MLLSAFSYEMGLLHLSMHSLQNLRAPSGPSNTYLTLPHQKKFFNPGCYFTAAPYYYIDAILQLHLTTVAMLQNFLLPINLYLVMRHHKNV